MRMFAHINTLKPICEAIGYENVIVDDSDSLMQYELPGFDEVKEQEQKLTEKKQDDRFKVHVGSSEFRHLKEHDMNKICARVTVIA